MAEMKVAAEPRSGSKRDGVAPQADEGLLDQFLGQSPITEQLHPQAVDAGACRW